VWLRVAGKKNTSLARVGCWDGLVTGYIFYQENHQAAFVWGSVIITCGSLITPRLMDWLMKQLHVTAIQKFSIFDFFFLFKTGRLFL
jgi:hypothetical protein